MNKTKKELLEDLSAIKEQLEAVGNESDADYQEVEEFLKWLQHFLREY